MLACARSKPCDLTVIVTVDGAVFLAEVICYRQISIDPQSGLAHTPHMTHPMDADAKVWKRYQVHIHGYGRKLIRRGPCEGLLEWPQHVWGVISTRPMGLKAAIALADAQPQHSVVTLYMAADQVHDNGKQPSVPEGWYPAYFQTPQDKPRAEAVAQ